MLEAFPWPCRACEGTFTSTLDSITLFIISVCLCLCHPPPPLTHTHTLTVSIAFCFFKKNKIPTSHHGMCKRNSPHKEARMGWFMRLISSLLWSPSSLGMSRWFNGTPFHICTYFRTCCWRPCYDLVEPVMGCSSLLWTATSLSYVNFLILLVLMFFSFFLLHTQTRKHACTHTHARTHDTHTPHACTYTFFFSWKALLFRTFPQIFWLEPAMQRWCNCKPFYVCTYFRTYCWRPAMTLYSLWWDICLYIML